MELQGALTSIIKTRFSSYIRFFLINFFFYFLWIFIICVSALLKVIVAKVHAANERDDWWRAFYQGAAFPTLARVLLLGNLYSFSKLSLLWQESNPLFFLYKICCLQRLLPIGSHVSLFQQRNISMMFSLSMDFQLKLYRFWFLTYSWPAVMFSMLMLFCQM